MWHRSFFILHIRNTTGLLGTVPRMTPSGGKVMEDKTAQLISPPEATSAPKDGTALLSAMSWASATYFADGLPST
jgi:hypothetical protein